MLGYAHEGLGDCRDFEPFLAMSCFTLLRLILRTLIVHIEGFIIAADPETSHPLFYRTAQSGCETICLALCLEMCNLPKIHLKFLKMKILAWNVQGAKKCQIREEIRYLKTI